MTHQTPSEIVADLKAILSKLLLEDMGPLGRPWTGGEAFKGLLGQSLVLALQQIDPTFNVGDFANEIGARVSMAKK